MATFAQFKDFGPFFSGGTLVAGTKIYHYIAGTNTLLNGYTDRTKVTPCAQPLVADSQGMATGYFDGIYKFVIADPANVADPPTLVLYTFDNVNLSDTSATMGKGANLVAASTLVLGTDGNEFAVTGSTGISLISGAQSQVTLAFTGTPILTNSGNLILLDGVNLTIAAGDVLVLANEGVSGGNYIFREVSRSVHRGTTASYTTTSNLADNVNLALLSGASFAHTLPLAASLTGREVTYIHRGTSLTMAYTITGNGGETIVGQDSTATTFVLYTNGERLRLKSNGVSWDVIQHDTRTQWADVGAMTITGTTSNPTKPNTPDIDKVYWRREGNQVHLKYILQTSSAAGAAAGTGVYLFALPSNITFDTTVLTPVSTPIASAVVSEAASSFLSSTAHSGIDTTSFSHCDLYAYDASHFQAWRPDAGPIGDTFHPLNSAELSYTFILNARAANWRL